MAWSSSQVQQDLVSQHQLYAALKEIKSERTNITTVEDPVEYQLDGVNQVQVLKI